MSDRTWLALAIPILLLTLVFITRFVLRRFGLLRRPRPDAKLFQAERVEWFGDYQGGPSHGHVVRPDSVTVFIQPTRPSRTILSMIPGGRLIARLLRMIPRPHPYFPPTRAGELLVGAGYAFSFGLMPLEEDDDESLADELAEARGELALAVRPFLPAPRAKKRSSKYHPRRRQSPPPRKGPSSDG